MTKKDYAHLAVILDRSASMGFMASEVIAGVNKFLDDQKKEPGEATFTLVQFDDKYEVVHDFVNIKDVPELTDKVYFVRGMTALMDAIGVTIRTIGAKLANMPEADRPSKVLVAIYTDGQENASKEYTLAMIQKMIKEQREKYSWEFTFTGIGEDSLAHQTAAMYGVDPLLVAQMNHDKAGVDYAMSLCSAAASGYRGSGGSVALRSAYINVNANNGSSGTGHS